MQIAILDQSIVSIHAPYIGSDHVHNRCHHGTGVSIHAPYIGSDPHF